MAGKNDSAEVARAPGATVSGDLKRYDACTKVASTEEKLSTSNHAQVLSDKEYENVITSAILNSHLAEKVLVSVKSPVQRTQMLEKTYAPQSSFENGK